MVKISKCSIWNPLDDNVLFFCCCFFKFVCLFVLPFLEKYNLSHEVKYEKYTHQRFKHPEEETEVRKMMINF